MLVIIETIFIAIKAGCIVGAARLIGYVLSGCGNPKKVNNCFHYASIILCVKFAGEILAYTGMTGNAGLVWQGIAKFVVAVVMGVSMLIVRFGGAYALKAVLNSFCKSPTQCVKALKTR